MNQILVTGNINNKPNRDNNGLEKDKNDMLNDENISNKNTITPYNQNNGLNNNENNLFSNDDNLLTNNQLPKDNFNKNLFSDNSNQEYNTNMQASNLYTPSNTLEDSYKQEEYKPNTYSSGFAIGSDSSDYNNISSSRNEKMSISLIVKIFAIAIIIFGVAILGNGVLAISQNSKQKTSQKAPEVTITRKGNILKLSVKSEVPLRSVGYAWNNEEFQYASAKQKTEYEMAINVIDGENNKLNIAIVDTSNKKTNYKEKYSKEPDTTEPEISISNEDPRIKIVVKDDTALDHVIYKYGNNQEQMVYADTEDPTKLEIYIDEIETTQATLSVEAVDKAQNHAEVTQEVKGTTKPVITIEPVSNEDPSILQISITCEDDLQKIIIYLGEKRYSTPDNVSINKKQFVQKVKVDSGTTIKVDAYNVSEQMTEKTITYNY